MDNKHAEIPLGFGMALAQNEKAFNNFATLPESKRNEYIERSHTVKTKYEMQMLIEEIEKLEI
ncbi:MAG: hypothetical protein DBX47_05465 [Clostridiales bacterium]|nr:MAG: hypothetical protein DBX47_05465 [Clostridiales bacterium]